jgi:hypothetical protein
MLKDNEIRHARPKERPYKLFDGGGLYLFVLSSHPQGAVGGASSTATRARSCYPLASIPPSG